MNMPHAPRRLPLLSILLGGMLLIVVIIIVIGWQRWQSITLTSDQYLREVTQAYSLATDPSKNIEKEARVQAITTLAGYQDRRLVCQGEWWYGWLADVVPASKQAADKCRNQAGAIEPVVVKANKLATYLEDETKLQKILASLVIDASKSDWQANALASVITVEADLAKFKESPESELTVETARQQVKTIATMWQTLNEASKKQDRKAYEAAVDGLDNSYGGLAVITEVSDETVKELLESLLIAGKKL